MGCIGENLNQVFPADPGYQNTSPRVGIKVGAGVRVFLFDFKSVQCYNIPIMSTVEGTCIERQTGIPRFSGETVRDLKGRGFRIYELTAQTWESFPKNYNHVLINPLSLQASLYSPKHSRKTEVAINTHMDFFFLPESCNKTFSEHQAMIDALDKVFSLKFPGTKVIMGSYLDYMEIVFQHENRDHTFASGWDMFSNSYDLKMTRAIGKGTGKSVAVGAYNNFGLTIIDVGDDFKSEKLFVSPLIIPA